MLKKTILVTGGAGYIGSELTQELLNLGYRVKIFDSFYFGKKHLESLRGKYELIAGDIRTLPRQLLDGVFAIIHLAAISNDPMADFAPKLCHEVNTKATERLAILAKEAGVVRFIFASSCSIYHHDKKNSQVFTENDAVHPKAQYSVSKYLAEQVLLQLSGKNFVITVIRMATVGGYSRRLKFDLAVNTMVKSALTSGEIIVFDGSQYRPLIDIRDVTKAYLTILETPTKKIQNQIFNLAYDNYLVTDLASQVSLPLKALGRPVKIIRRKASYDIKSYRVSAEKIRRIGVRPQFSVDKTALQLLQEIKKRNIKDFDNPIYNNFLWSKDILARLSSSL